MAVVACIIANNTPGLAVMGFTLAELHVPSHWSHPPPLPPSQGGYVKRRAEYTRAPPEYQMCLLVIFSTLLLATKILPSQNNLAKSHPRILQESCCIASLVGLAGLQFGGHYILLRESPFLLFLQESLCKIVLEGPQLVSAWLLL